MKRRSSAVGPESLSSPPTVLGSRSLAPSRCFCRSCAPTGTTHLDPVDCRRWESPLEEVHHAATAEVLLECSQSVQQLGDEE